MCSCSQGTGKNEREILVRVSTRVVVVVVRELFSLVTSVICVRIRGRKIVYHMTHVLRLLLRSHHSEFVGTISPLFCYVNIKLLLFFVD